MERIVLNIPHSSCKGVLQYGWKVDVMPYVNRMTDWHTDILFNREDPRIKSVVFPLSRFVCDVERLENDEMEKIGQGICYERFREAKRNVV
ncbi:MAG: N-formylglutamate amidohydrolase [Bacteroidales bacterium]|nr:N-formylglutamate amidohydrolase [Bacteroidales bacterium]